MKQKIQNAIKNSTNLKHIEKAIMDLFLELKKEKSKQKIGYVAGIVTSDGEENMQRNIERLEKLTEKLREKLNFPIFSSVDIFGGGIYDKIEDFHLERPLREKAFIKFWRVLLKSGHITDIYMTPRWDESKGAKDEHKTAKETGIEIHYVNEELEELPR